LPPAGLLKAEELKVLRDVLMSEIQNILFDILAFPVQTF
jgi:hypothetical protein